VVNVDSLRKILNLEQSKGYADTAVIGGLDRFLGNWTGQVMASITSPQLLKRFHKLAGNSYASQTEQQRKEWVSGLLDLLAEIESQGRGKDKLPEGSGVSPSSVKLSSRPRRATATVTGSNLDSPITVIKGISSSLATRFGKLGVKTVRDLLYFFPHRHLDYSRVNFISQLGEGEEQTIIAKRPCWGAGGARKQLSAMRPAISGWCGSISLTLPGSC